MKLRCGVGNTGLALDFKVIASYSTPVNSMKLRRAPLTLRSKSTLHSKSTLRSNLLRPWMLPVYSLLALSVGGAVETTPWMLSELKIAGLVAVANDVVQGDRLLDEAQKQYQNGQLREALATYQKARDTFRQGSGEEIEQLRRDDGAAGATQMMGLIYARLGQYQLGLETLQEAIRLYSGLADRAGASNFRTVPDHPGLQILFRSKRQVRSSLSFLSLVYYRLGQYPKALDLSRDAIARSNRNMGDYALDGEIFNQLGTIYASQGEYQKSLEAYYRALLLIEQVGYPLGRDISKGGKPVNFIAANQLIYGFQQPTGKALTDYLEQAIQPNFHQEGRMNPWARGLFTMTLNNLGDLYGKMGKSQARLFYLKALNSSKFARSLEQEALSLNNVGNSYSPMNDSDAKGAVSFYQQALEVSRQLGDRALEGKTLNNLGNLYLKTGNYAAAATQLNAAIASWESLRPGLSDENLVSLFETQAKTYDALQTALVAQKKYGEALEIAERGRARAFVEMLARRLKPVDASPATVTPLTIRQIQQVAQSQRSTLVEYSLIGDERLYIWVVKPTGDIAFEQVDLKAFLARRKGSLADYVNAVRFDGLGVRGRSATAPPPSTPRRIRGSAAAASSDLKQLYQLLIQPIANHLPQEPGARVVFVPQGSLFLIPFAALQNANGKYLIEDYTIAITPSIQVLDLASKQAAQQGNQSEAPHATTPPRHHASASHLSPTLIVGNPTMPKVAIAAGTPAEQLSPLPGAEAEAREIAALLKTEALIGNQATEFAVTQQMPTQRVIHLATHGMLDDFKGLGVPGAIALAPDPTQSGDRGDGLLTANEILDLKLNSRLVVLSACDTGRGKITGDGVIGLSRSLILAGTSSVVVSLWAVPDAATATLMTEFYQALLTNPNKSAALRQAMLNTLKQYPDPRDWAAFVIIGSNNE
jgi:CHAT domain-containing protein/tetratricopeptide (TPR) repeat protein